MQERVRKMEWGRGSNEERKYSWLALKMDGDLYVIPRENSPSFHLLFFLLIFPSSDFFLLLFPSDFFLLFLHRWPFPFFHRNHMHFNSRRKCNQNKTLSFLSIRFFLSFSFLFFILEKGSNLFSVLSIFRRWTKMCSRDQQFFFFTMRSDFEMMFRLVPNRSVSEPSLELSSPTFVTTIMTANTWTTFQWSRFPFNATGFFLFGKILLHLFKKWISSFPFQSSNQLL